jgi:hypothetical protein
MRPSSVLALALCLSAANPPARAADGPKPCEDLRREIAAKIDARGVPRYALEIVVPAAVGDRKVVGSCDGGGRRIVYLRLPAQPEPAPAAATVASRDG